MTPSAPLHRLKHRARLLDLTLFPKARFLNGGAARFHAAA